MLFLSIQYSSLKIENSVIDDVKISEELKTKSILVPSAFGLVFHAETSKLEIISTTFSNIKNALSGGSISAESSLGSLFFSNPILLIKNSSFINNTVYQSGGAVKIIDQQLEVLNSTFQNNTCENSGGTFRLECSVRTLNEFQGNCTFLFTNNTFGQNTAGLEGGAISYDLIEPSGLETNVFAGNTA